MQKVLVWSATLKYRVNAKAQRATDVAVTWMKIDAKAQESIKIFIFV